MSGVLYIYIPFIRSRHNAKDRSLGVGRDIIYVFVFLYHFFRLIKIIYFVTYLIMFLISMRLSICVKQKA